MSTSDCFPTSSAAFTTAVTLASIQNIELAAVMDSLAQLYPTSSNFFSIPTVSQPLDSVIQALSLPLLTIPLSTMSLSSSIDQALCSPLSINTQFSSSSSGYSTLTLASPIALQPMSDGSLLPPLGDSNHLSPPLNPSTLRRQSAPEGMLRPPVIPEKRRYSDFSVDSLLNQPCCSSSMEHRRNSARKQRTIYGAKQTEVLEEAFTSQKYMVGTERELLATRLGLTEAQVRVWFQNRRSKQRKIQRIEEEKQQKPQLPQDML